ncbi:MAG: response regulator transcription factor [Deltaproteobacteria bacterium]|nr:response regulator transcription factor [Deltaproteobacteria bacterium]
MRQHVLLIEDDATVGRQVADHLQRAGYAVTWWTEGCLIDPHTASSVQLVVLDLTLPGTDGLDILKDVRCFSEVPVLVLSARTDSSYKTRALRLGADDFVSKPFWPDELLARVDARLRRPLLRRPGPIEAGPLRIDLEAAAVHFNGEPVHLTAVEFGILAALAVRPGQAVTRGWLVDNHLDPHRAGGARTLDVHVSRLRKKLGDQGIIETVFGIGYRFRGSVTS